MYVRVCVHVCVRTSVCVCPPRRCWSGGASCSRAPGGPVAPQASLPFREWQDSIHTGTQLGPHPCSWPPANGEALRPGVSSGLPPARLPATWACDKATLLAWLSQVSQGQTKATNRGQGPRGPPMPADHPGASAPDHLGATQGSSDRRPWPLPGSHLALTWDTLTIKPLVSRSHRWRGERGAEPGGGGRPWRKPVPGVDGCREGPRPSPQGTADSWAGHWPAEPPWISGPGRWGSGGPQSTRLLGLSSWAWPSQGAVCAPTVPSAGGRGQCGPHCPAGKQRPA